jgi:hypothetical protein
MKKRKMKAGEAFVGMKRSGSQLQKKKKKKRRRQVSDCDIWDKSRSLLLGFRQEEGRQTCGGRTLCLLAVVV